MFSEGFDANVPAAYRDAISCCGEAAAGVFCNAHAQERPRVTVRRCVIFFLFLILHNHYICLQANSDSNLNRCGVFHTRSCSSKCFTGERRQKINRWMKILKSVLIFGGNKQQFKMCPAHVETKSVKRNEIKRKDKQRRRCMHASKLPGSICNCRVIVIFED